MARDWLDEQMDAADYDHDRRELERDEIAEWYADDLCTAADRETGLSCLLPADHDGPHEIENAP